MQQPQIICLTKGCQYPKIIKPGELLMHTKNSHQIINIQKMKDKLQFLYPNICIPKDEYILEIDKFKEKVGDILTKYIKDLIQRETKNYSFIQLIQKITNDQITEQDLKSDNFNVLADCYNEYYALKIDFGSKEQLSRIREILNTVFQQIQKIISEGPYNNQRCNNQSQTPTPKDDSNQTELSTQIRIDQRPIQKLQQKIQPMPQIQQIQQIQQQDSYEFCNQGDASVFLKLMKNNTQIQNIAKENIEQIARVKVDMTQYHQMTFFLQKQIIKIGVIDYSQIEEISSDSSIGKCFITITDDPQRQYITNGANREQVPFEIKIQSILNLEWDPNSSSLSFLCSKKKKKITFNFDRTDVSNFDIMVWLGQGAKTQVQNTIS